MVGSSTSEQQACLEQANVLRPSRPHCAELLERQAIRSAQRGDESSFERIYQLHCRRAYGLCLRMTGNPVEAEDLCQEAFLTVFCKIQTFRGEAAFSTWLHRIAANLVLMSLRRRPFPEAFVRESSRSSWRRTSQHTIHVRCPPDYKGRKCLADTVPPAQAHSSNAWRYREPTREAHLPKSTASVRRHRERRVPTRLQ